MAKTTPRPMPAPTHREAPDAPRPVAAPAGPRRVKVRATADGYTGDQRYVRAGDVFMIDTRRRNAKTGEPAEFSDKWMEYVDPQTPEKVTSHGEALERQRRDTLAEKSRSAGGSRTDPLAED